MYVLVTTMVGTHYEQIKQKQKEIEVRALVALAAYGTPLQNSEACQKLREIAYPEILADKINQETLEDMDVVFGDEA